MSNSKSEASSVDSILDKLVNEAIMVTLSQNFKIGDELKTYKEAKAKINCLIARETLKARIDELNDWIEDYSQAYVEYKHTSTDKKGMTLTPTKSETYIALSSIKERLEELEKELDE